MISAYALILLCTLNCLFSLTMILEYMISSDGMAAVWTESLAAPAMLLINIIIMYSMLKAMIRD